MMMMGTHFAAIVPGSDVNATISQVLRVAHLSNLNRNTAFRKYAVLLCLVAIVALLCVQAGHMHLGPNASSDQAHCAICSLIHSASTALCVALLLLAVPANSHRFQRRPLKAHFKSHFSGFASFCRPPPLR